MTVLLVIVALACTLPFLAWLASSSSSPKPWAGVVEEVIPGPNPTGKVAPSNLPAAKKYAASTNDVNGAFGIKHAPGLSLNEAVAGWSTPEEADRELNLPPGTTSHELSHAGFKKMRSITMDVIFNGTLQPTDTSFQWSPEDPDKGVFIRQVAGDLVLEDVTHARKDRTGLGEVAKGGGKVTYVRGDDVKDAQGRKLSWGEYHPSPDLTHVMFFTEVEKVWRHSKRFNVWLYDARERRTYPVGPHNASISNAQWVPKTSSSLAFVQDNDLYVAMDPKNQAPIRVTHDGTATIFNAAADWVYEEEVLETDHAMYFSPKGTKLAYLRFDETDVPVYEFPIYNNDSKNAGHTTPYLQTVKMKYPKPGFANPIVTAHLVDLQSLVQKSGSYDDPNAQSARFELATSKAITAASTDKQANRVDTAMSSKDGQKERLITEVVWLSDSDLYLVETNRHSDMMRGLLFDTSAMGAATNNSIEGVPIRHLDVGESSWIDPNPHTMALGVLQGANDSTTAYLEVLPNDRGFRHLALFRSAHAHQPQWMTGGEWEVDKLLFADMQRRKVYFSAAAPTHYRRHIFVVDLPDISDPNAKVTPTSSPSDLTSKWKSGSFSADIDPHGAYYLLQSTGPRVPSTRVVGIDDPSFEWVVEDNKALTHTTNQFVKAQTVYYNVTTADGVTTTVQELRPHDFDASGLVRYPVLFSVYGGPESQQVDSSYLRSHWHEFLANQLGYIVARVDGRGTGFKGANYSRPVTKHLGELETRDLIETARKMRGLPYVDESRMGIWGWSYGAYLTTKVLEADSGLLNLGIAVAPPTRWEFYDSVYTERFMKSPVSNSVGYENSSVHVSDGFKKVNFALAHGSGDDNVHFESSAHLLDLLTSKAAVRGGNFWFRMFTDSSHSMSTRGAYRELHEWMTDFLRMKWGAGGKRRFEGKGGMKGLVEQHGSKRGADAWEEERWQKQQRDIDAVTSAPRRRER